LGGALAACVPRVRPLTGAPVAPATLPRLVLSPTRERLVFRWRYEEEGFSARGDGAARVAPLDSARLDFFLDGGYGGGWAVLIGETVRTPPGSVGRRLIPPGPMLWAALGRLSVPGAVDTTVRALGDTLRADLTAGRDEAWRVTAAAGSLTGLERLRGGRVVERVTRDSARVRYEDLAGRRSLAIDIQRRESANAFPPAIWIP
jgi:hypothetical protein